MPLNNHYPTQDCNVAGALEILGERWTLLILRSLMLGICRYGDIQSDLGISTNILQSRLAHLVEHHVVERRRYQDRPPRYEYILTERGRSLWPVIVSLMQWGDKYIERPDGPPLVLEHGGCGGAPDDHLTCDRCGQRLTIRDVRPILGPGASRDHPLRRHQATLARLAPSETSARAS